MFSYFNVYSMQKWTKSFINFESKKDEDLYFNYNYNFDESVVQLLGMPRFDSLKNEESKKQIIIMPSWRRDLTRKSDEYIINSE